MANADQAAQTAPSVLREQELLDWLRAHEGLPIAYVYTKKLFAVFRDDDSAAELRLCDIDTAGFSALKSFAKRSLLKRFEVTDDVLVGRVFRDTAWSLLPAAVSDLTQLKKLRDDVFGRGRGKPISQATTLRVWADAGARCMYQGCGESLSEIPLSTSVGQIAYLAHIIASDPDGPRGDDNHSHARSDDHENIMLMCDAHHRLIDRTDEAGHPTPRLQSMRATHIVRVRYLLQSLRYPRTNMMTLLANLADVPTNESEVDLKNAVIDRGLSPIGPPQQEIRRFQRDDRTNSEFWSHLLHEHERDIQQYQRNLKDALREHTVAIYPLHLVPMLVLAGRIAGEASPIEVFQYHRERRSWRWDPHATAYPHDAIFLESTHEGSTGEVVLSIELTANIDEGAIPETLRHRILNGEVGWLRIRHVTPCHSSIRHPDDLDNFTRVARQAISLIQDGIRANVVHLFGISPASALFRFGQLLQPGHHPPYQVYDRPNNASLFSPGLEVHGDSVVAASRSNPENIKSVQLR
ncbi:MAG: SAVED domain-containing protein [Pseudomonadota bacterium]